MARTQHHHHYSRHLCSPRCREQERKRIGDRKRPCNHSVTTQKMIRSKQRKSLGIQTNSKASGGGCEIRTHAPVKANGFQDRLVMTTSITLRVFNFIKNRNPSQGKLRENCEKRFSQSASDDAKNPIKSRVFKKLHKQTKEVFKTASLWPLRYSCVSILLLFFYGEYRRPNGLTLVNSLFRRFALYTTRLAYPFRDSCKLTYYNRYRINCQWFFNI